MSDERLARELAKIVREDEERSAALVTRAHDGTEPDDDEDAFVRQVLAGGNDDRLVSAALAATQRASTAVTSTDDTSAAVTSTAVTSAAVTSTAVTNADDTNADDTSADGASAAALKSDTAKSDTAKSDAAKSDAPKRDTAKSHVAVKNGASTDHVSGGPNLAVVDPLPRSRARARWVPIAASALTLAAALAVFVRSRGGHDALPPYEAVLSGADAVDRAAPSGKDVVSHGASLVLVAQPREDVTGPLEARAFAGCGGAIAPIAAPVVIAPTGAARIDGKPESLFGPTAEGPCSLALAIGRPGAVPERLDGASAAGSAVVRVDVFVRRP